MYSLNVNSADFIQNNGSAITLISTKYNNGIAKGAGTPLSDGPLDSVDVVKVHSGQYGGIDVAGIRGSVGPANWTFIEAGSADEGPGIWQGYVKIETNSSNTVSVGDTVIITDNAGESQVNYSGSYRVLAKVDNASFIINRQYIVSADPVNIYDSVAKSETDSSFKDIGNTKPEQYYIKYSGISVYNGISTVNTLSSPASDYNRRKINSREGVRTHLIENAIRSGNWNIYTGKFSAIPSIQNDIGAFGTDDEVQDSASSYGLKGEYTYRYGITIQNDY